MLNLSTFFRTGHTTTHYSLFTIHYSLLRPTNPPQAEKAGPLVKGLRCARSFPRP